MARVLMLSLVYGPDTVSTAVLMTELTKGLQKKGHEITVLTSMPHYNPSDEVLSNPLYRASFFKFFTETVEDGIRVLRVYMPLKSQRIWLRIFDYLWFHIITTCVALATIRSQRIIFVPSPPITLGLNGYLLAKLYKAKLIYDVLELWPDAPIRMGFIKNKSLVRLAYWVESFVYRHSSIVACIAQTFVDALLKRGVPAEKLRLAPLFVDVERISPRPKKNTFSCKHELQDKFVALYAGNIGLSQGVEMLAEVAGYLQKEEGIRIVIIGDGARRPKLEQAVTVANLSNIYLLPFQPYECVPDIYATADVALSPMQPGHSHESVPSKIFTVMASGRPTIAACEPNTETSMLIAHSRGGLTVPPGSAKEMADAILYLYKNPDKTKNMGEHGRKWVVDNYSKNAVIAMHDNIIIETARK